MPGEARFNAFRCQYCMPFTLDIIIKTEIPFSFLYFLLCYITHLCAFTETYAALHLPLVCNSQLHLTSVTAMADTYKTESVDTPIPLPDASPTEPAAHREDDDEQPEEGMQ